MVFVRRSLHHQEPALGWIQQNPTLFPSQRLEAGCHSQRGAETRLNQTVCNFTYKSLQPLLDKIHSLELALKESQQQNTLLAAALQLANEAVEVTSTEPKLKAVNRNAGQCQKEDKEQFQTIVEALPLSMVVSRVADGTVLYANPEVELTFGIPAAQMVGHQAANFYANPDNQAQLLRQLTKDGFLKNYEVQVKKHDGSLVWVAVSLRYLTFEGEAALLSVFSEITERRQAEARLRLMERAIAASSNGIVLTDAQQPDNPIIYANPAFEVMTGYTAAEVVGNNCRFLQGLDRDQPALQTLRAAIQARKECHVTLQNHRKDGTPFWNELHVAPVFDPSGCVTHFVGIQTDISDRKQMEDQLVHAALHDALTQLPNRVLFMNRLTHAISHSQSHPDHQFAMLFLDLDRFKIVNDSLGHIVGDQLLVAIAHRLETCLRPGDTIARFGGDEFTILLDPVTQPSEAVRIAEHILQALQVPFTLNGSEVFTTASIGIVSSAISYTRPEEVLRDADAALYRAKEQGKACYAVFDSKMYEQAVALLQLETDLRRAINRQEFRVFYQPIVSLLTGKVTGFEALVRWEHPERGLISPAEFIPVAEETGLIVPIGQWVLQEACQQLQQWQAHSTDSPLVMNVNLSAKQFSQPDLVKQVAQILQQT
ncbi:MAG TPA: diguanylate cyclase, partial [Leptolyngbyaceae cyanobacterium]